MSGRPWLIAVTVDGVNLPRFLRRAGEMGLLLTGVRIRGKHLSAFAREDDVMTLRMMAENGGWRFSVGNRQGTGRLMTWIRHRLALLSALMLGIGALIGASQVMWRVEIENAGIYAADLPEYLQALGITPPMRKSDVHPGQLRDLLEWRYPETAWVECGWRGMTLLIRVVDGVPAGTPLSETGAGDVVAARDGIVDSIRTYGNRRKAVPCSARRRGAQGANPHPRRGTHGQRRAGGISARGGDGARVGRGCHPHGLDRAAHIVFRAHGGKRVGRQPVVRPVA